MSDGRTGVAEWRAVADLHHAYFTGLIMSVVTRRSAGDAAEFVFRVFRRQHHERFLPGLAKLGLTGLPPAVAAAQYHYLSNWIGGVHVEYMPESDRKAWIRYPPPRWIWSGTAICAIPGEVSRAMLRGWHAHNGVSLGNPRLGFVCTKQTVDGQDGLEGYYCEYDHDLAPEERLVFARHLEAPDFDPAKAPVLPVDTWPAERLARAHRDYAMDYVRTALPVMIGLFGPEEGGHLLHITGRLIGMQYGAGIGAALGAAAGGGAAGFADLLSRFFRTAGDEVMARSDTVVAQAQWRLMRDVVDDHPACRLALSGLVEGMLAAYGRHMSVTASADGAAAGGAIWEVRSRRH
ncbi:hypothetical protein JQ557_28710 [Bradyrhizobium sp. U87765 SZCCT0131]|uniref:hypothetical protein n=1 Tax=unclassified Bradyrhizobium TaxID=2631580 RepID=UPI001BA47E39|nr:MULTISPECIES: hypothetical protein [unclassified Bradyrhizobium]MBR1222015.1 hypothetical protein [Bradyrhizobium sp. U87765 SZCCT0131]MBR1263787.1 hypothetical protein [Bradyrhizobium sp. U87765 SZCCT0134]MBR1302643.1 hypothetical protein [Bradyrhizobium sp. U87765 SZCCT0110]MBR1320037.1 hypothetical protein [Bradyrhizobium sp. U87765 SZCCT0109]MBR1348850.1 hypothetical protein [Bradyrhizobium sp. U87765 SZCCT0048]